MKKPHKEARKAARAEKNHVSPIRYFPKPARLGAMMSRGQKPSERLHK